MGVAQPLAGGGPVVVEGAAEADAAAGGARPVHPRHGRRRRQGGIASTAVARGTLIAESLRVGTVLDGPALTVGSIRRVAAGLSAQQRAAGLPERWTLIAFEVPDERADALAAALDAPGWYADPHTGERSFVVFAARVFAYDRARPIVTRSRSPRSTSTWRSSQSR